ncbi:hypothetical protein WM11_21535 [Burkholderia ubonensis]|nr:hypothetical protein WM10_17440 [Burkholderia ubonensis]KWI99196.1 hypothetical protein WM11_21535 [Burkholderia ubonensis]KWK03242.1 hypothetical protein WM12_27815 [Burkholderia ubonensis]KWK44207.1 hypothetical protein WM14_11655 [Burkholderia ubonensis]KWK46273.1 hypothetical protein WM13_06225 [Burkholderia ubonensis]
MLFLDTAPSYPKIKVNEICAHRVMKASALEQATSGTFRAHGMFDRWGASTLRRVAGSIG